jgi:hypothetical protein
MVILLNFPFFALALSGHIPSLHCPFIFPLILPPPCPQNKCPDAVKDLCEMACFLHSHLRGVEVSFL